jgi:hypothetical protein
MSDKGMAIEYHDEKYRPGRRSKRMWVWPGEKEGLSI